MSLYELLVISKNSRLSMYITAKDEKSAKEQAEHIEAVYSLGDVGVSVEPTGSTFYDSGECDISSIPRISIN